MSQVGKVHPAQVFQQIFGRFFTLLEIIARQRLWRLEQGDKPAHPGLVTPGNNSKFTILISSVAAGNI